MWIGCLKPIDVAFASEAKFDLVVKLEVEFEHQVNNEIFWTWMILLNSTHFPCGGGLFMFCVRLKMMNGNICYVVGFR
jgi:hypothetical protein